MKTPIPWQVVGWIAVVALSSGSIGAAVALHIQNQRLARGGGLGGVEETRLERLVELLRLNEAQQASVRRIIERGTGELRAIASASSVQAAEVSRRLDEEIRPFLDPEQQRRFDRLGEVRQRIRERLKAGERLTPEQREWLRERIEQRHGPRAWAEERRPGAPANP